MIIEKRVARDIRVTAIHPPPKTFFSKAFFLFANRVSFMTNLRKKELMKKMEEKKQEEEILYHRKHTYTPKEKYYFTPPLCNTSPLASHQSTHMKQHNPHSSIVAYRISLAPAPRITPHSHHRNAHRILLMH